MQGGSGNDTLQDTSGNGAFDGGAGNDTLAAGAGNDILAGGAGNDTLTLGAGADIVAFDLGDGVDTISAPLSGAGLGETNDVLSIGKIRLADITLSRETNDLVLRVAGTGDAVRFTNWYASGGNQTFTKLQVVVDSSADYAPGGTDLLRSQRVAVLDLVSLVTGYDSARAGNPTLVNWAPPEALLQSSRISSSDSLAYGGNLAWRYAQDATLANVAYDSGTSQLAAGFGSTAQDILNPLNGASGQFRSAATAMSPSEELIGMDGGTIDVAEPAGASLVTTMAAMQESIAPQDPATLVATSPTEMNGSPTTGAALQTSVSDVLQVSIQADDGFTHAPSVLSMGGQASAETDASVSEDGEAAQLAQALAQGAQKAADGSSVPGASMPAAKSVETLNVDFSKVPELPIPTEVAANSLSGAVERGRDEAAWTLAGAEATVASSSDVPQALQQLWGQVDAWIALEQALSPVGSGAGAELALADGPAEGQQLAFSGMLKADVTTALGTTTRLEQVAEFRMVQTF
jgi:hypothetical protein